MKSQFDVLGEAFDRIFDNDPKDKHQSEDAHSQASEASAADDTAAPSGCQYETDGDTCDCPNCEQRCWLIEVGDKNCDCCECDKRREDERDSHRAAIAAEQSYRAWRSKV